MIWRKSSALRLPLRPERGESCSAPSPPWIYRRLHLATWLKCIPTRSPMARTPNPWAANSTTRALCATPCGVLWARINCCNFSFSAEFNTSFPLCLGIQTSKHICQKLSLLFKRHYTSESEVASQVDLVRNITRSKPAGILLAALDSKGLIPPVEDADKAGVPVVMVDSGIDSDIPKASITTDNYKGGYLAGLQMAKLLGEKGLVANLGIQAGSVSSQRSIGFNDAIAKYPNMKVLPVQWTNADAAASMNIASDQLNGNPNIAGFFSACAPTAIGVCQAIKGKGLEKKVKVVTFDPSPEVLPLFESGVIDCIIAQDPYQMGYQGVDAIDKARNKVAIEKKKVELAPVVITPANYKTPEVQKLLQTPEKFQ